MLTLFLKSKTIYMTLFNNQLILSFNHHFTTDLNYKIVQIVAWCGPVVIFSHGIC